MQSDVSVELQGVSMIKQSGVGVVVGAVVLVVVAKVELVDGTVRVVVAAVEVVGATVEEVLDARVVIALVVTTLV